MNVAVWSQTFQQLKEVEWHTEGWFRTTYTFQDFKPEWIQGWKNCGKSPEFALPKKNDFIAEDFALKRQDYEVKNLEEPLSASVTSRLWYRPDNDYHVPKAYINFCIRSTEVLDCSKNICLQDLYVIALKHLACVAGYPAELAHLRYSIQVLDGGFCLKFHGFSDKLPLLFTRVVDCIANFEISDKLFAQICKELTEAYRSICLCPEKLNKDLSKSLLYTKHNSVMKKIACISTVARDQLVHYAQGFYQGAYIEGLVQGNLTPEEASRLECYLLQKLNIKPTASDDCTLSTVQITKIPEGCSTYTVNNQNANDENSVFLIYYQIGSVDEDKQMMNELLVMNMEEPCFSHLRAKMQLGYHIQLNHSSAFGVTGFWITVCTQASRFTAEYVKHLVEAFLRMHNADCIQAMTEPAFKEFINSVIKLKNYGDANLSEEMTRHWAEVVKQTYEFERHDAEISILQRLTLDDLKTYADELLNPNEGRRKLVVEVLGHIRNPKGVPKPKKPTKKQSKETKEANPQVIGDIDRFKSICERYTFTRGR